MQSSKKNVSISAVYRLCAAICELDEMIQVEPYCTCIAQAESVVGKEYEQTNDIQRRIDLIEAIKLNLINRKEYTYNFLQRKYMLPVSRNKFIGEKKKFCFELYMRLYNTKSLH